MQFKRKCPIDEFQEAYFFFSISKDYLKLKLILVLKNEVLKFKLILVFKKCLKIGSTRCDSTFNSIT